MNDSLIQAMPPALQVEIETLRDQRDLYRSLLLSELEPLAACMTHALETVERIRAALRMTTRDDGAFRGKIERLQGELTSLERGHGRPASCPASARAWSAPRRRCRRSNSAPTSAAMICCRRW